MSEQFSYPPNDAAARESSFIESHQEKTTGKRRRAVETLAFPHPEGMPAISRWLRPKADTTGTGYPIEAWTPKRSPSAADPSGVRNGHLITKPVVSACGLNHRLIAPTPPGSS